MDEWTARVGPVHRVLLARCCVVVDPVSFGFASKQKRVIAEHDRSRTTHAGTQAYQSHSAASLAARTTIEGYDLPFAASI